jgi:hypothetical protein
MFLTVGNKQISDQRIVVMLRRLVYLAKVSRQRVFGIGAIRAALVARSTSRARLGNSRFRKIHPHRIRGVGMSLSSHD